MSKTMLYIALALIAVWFLYSRMSGANVNGLKELDASAFQQELAESSDYTFIDVREPSEVRQGYIKGAINIPLGQLATRLQEINKNKPVKLYCRSGNRSKQAAKILLDNGYDDVTHLKGGILAWKGSITK
jgi:rhodanese-related sulfurtransferase